MKTQFLILLLLVSFLTLHGQLIELEKELIANYLFDGNAQDLSGYNNHGLVQGPVLTEDRFGNESSAYLFDGFDDYIVVQDADILSFPEQEFSVALWVKPYLSKHSFMIYKGSTRADREYAIGITRDTLASVHINDFGADTAQYGIASETVIRLKDWYHIVEIWDGVNLSIYINGKLENRIAHNVTITNNGSDLFIGTYGGGISQYATQGIIDDIFIYSRVINDCEIDALYTGELFNER